MPEKIISRMAVFVIIRKPTGELLLQQRANTGYMDGFYDLSCSGHVDEGESIREAAIRELAEEIGVKATEDDLQLIHINQNFLDQTYANFTFLVDKWQGEPTLCEPEKCSDLDYFAPDALPEKCTLSVRVNQRYRFGPELTYSKVTPDNYAEYMGVEYGQT